MQAHDDADVLNALARMGAAPIPYRTFALAPVWRTRPSTSGAGMRGNTRLASPPPAAERPREVPSRPPIAMAITPASAMTPTPAMTPRPTAPAQVSAAPSPAFVMAATPEAGQPSGTAHRPLGDVFRILAAGPVRP